MKRFKPYYPEDEEPCMETKYYIREFSGPMTAKRMQRLMQYACNILTWEEHCGCAHDCCGCQFRQDAKVTYEYGQVVIIVAKHFNY